MQSEEESASEPESEPASESASESASEPASELESEPESEPTIKPISPLFVCKYECVYSFGTPTSHKGLYVCLESFMSFRYEYAQRYYKASGRTKFLRISAKENAYGYDYAFIVMPHWNVPIDYEISPFVSAEVKTAIKFIIMHNPPTQKERDEFALESIKDPNVNATPFGEILRQFRTKKRIRSSGWVCEVCGTDKDLWLNLSDGAVLCGRRFFESNSGNGHALMHHLRHHFPLAVKLDTIDRCFRPLVFCYTDDMLVRDNHIKKHLAWWGINVDAMTPKAQTAAELALEKRERRSEFLAISQERQKLISVSGPGLTGLRNLGNSCYLSSVMQLLFSIEDFQQEFSGERAYSKFKEFPPNAAEDFTIQMCKLGNELMMPIEDVPVAPAMFKRTVGKHHPEFSSNTQQDAYEFYAHILRLVDKEYDKAAPENPVRALRFLLEYRYQCEHTGTVRYEQHAAIALTLKLSSSLKKAHEAERRAHGHELRPGEVVFHEELLRTCFKRLFGVQRIKGFRNPHILHETVAKKSMRMLTMPDYLLLRIDKFYVAEDWSPAKLNVIINMPHTLDLSAYRKAGGFEAGEVPMLTDADVPPRAWAVTKTLVEMGYTKEVARRACEATEQRGYVPALDWIAENYYSKPKSEVFQRQPNSKFLQILTDMGFAHYTASTALRYNDNQFEATLSWLLSGTYASTETSNHRATLDSGNSSWFTRWRSAQVTDSANSSRSSSQASSRRSSLEEHPGDECCQCYTNASGKAYKSACCNTAAPFVSASSDKVVDTSDYRDGDAKYELIAIVSHMGRSSQSGHYVCHVRKTYDSGDNEQCHHLWAYFDDDKVVWTDKPCKDLGYLYLYRRVKENTAKSN